MGVLQFDGVDDRLRWTTLAGALQNVSDGAWTVAALVKRSGLTTWDAMSYLLSGSGAGTTEAGISFGQDVGSEEHIKVDITGEAGSSFPTALTSTASPYLLVASKAAGTVAPRLAWKLGSGGLWTHENGASTVPDQAIATFALDIGSWQNGDFFLGWIGVIGWWEGAMSDANKEALDNNWRTSDWWNSAHGRPLFLAELNVAGASVVDLAGNASSLTATGTTLDAAETLDSWNFNGIGAPAVLADYSEFPKPPIREAALRGEM